MNFDGLILDGAMGSLLLERSGIFASSETFNASNPALVKQIHLDYIQAGANVIFANTFGCNPQKREDYAVMLRQALDIAQAAKEESGKNVKIALDVGPTGKILGKAGISFDLAYDSFAQVVRAGEGKYDMVVIETMTDLAEMRAAILAAKDNADRPVWASMSFEKGGHTAFGCSVESFAVTATALGADAVGINCSVGPIECATLFARLTENTQLPTFVKPNAGMPQIYRGKSIYSMTAEAFAKAMGPIVQRGAAAVGGCCGTTPAYIAALCQAANAQNVAKSPYTYRGILCSQSKTVIPQGGTVIGERINPTGKKLLQAAIREGNLDYVVALGPKQEEEGAEMLDVNIGLSGTKDADSIQEVVERLQCVVNTPLVIDSSSAKTIEKGLRYYAGRALVNSVNGEDEVMDEILPFVKRYGAAVVGLTLDKNGIPDTVEGRLSIAEKILSRAEACGIAKEDVYIDCLTMAEGAGIGNARLTVECLKRVKRLGCRTVLGVSNISYGMPLREDLNAAFLQMAKEAGLDAAIVNPIYKGLKPSKEALSFLQGEIRADDYIAYAAQATTADEKTTTETITIEDAVRRGDGATVKALTAQEIEKGNNPTPLIIAALDEVGVRYEQGKFFLPQLIAAADAAKAGFDLLYAKTGESAECKGKLVIATVKGDVHDIGKNIVKSVVANYGYKVVDLGKDVPTEKILESLEKEMPCVLGLSALMTTTAENMAEIVREVRKVYPVLDILVGGAVITPAFAEEIRCVYCRDAAATVREMNRIQNR